MSLRRKMFVYMIMATCSLYFVLFVILDNTLIDKFKKLENDNLRENMKQILLSYYDDLNNLGTLTLDYSGWDDTYQFIERTPIPNVDDPYLVGNYSDSLFQSSKLNLVLLLNKELQVYYSKLYDYVNNQSMDDPGPVLEALNKTYPDFLVQTDPDASKYGLVMVQGKPIIAAAYPILTSNNEGPVRGTLLFARYFDSSYIQQLSQKTDRAIRFIIPESQYIPPAEAEELKVTGNRTVYYWTDSSNEVSVGYTLLTDILDRPAVLIQFEKNRMLYQEAKNSVWVYAAFLVLSGICFFLIMAFLMDRTMFSRLNRIVEAIHTINKNQDFTVRVHESTEEDEITQMEQSFNLMMNSLQQAKSKIQYQAEHDPLTGLLNRSTFRTSLEARILISQQMQSRFAVLYLDLDGFKEVNDTMGHRAGDALLVEVGERLRQCTIPEDILCRMGGDEFCIISATFEEELQIEGLALSILSILDLPFDLPEGQAAVSASIGISLYPEHGSEAEALLHMSDTAMLKAKDRGKRGFYLYSMD